MKKALGLIFLFSLILRLYQVGRPALKEDEYMVVAQAAYVYHCQVNKADCRHQSTSLKSRTLALMTANETVPNLGAEIYLWNFISRQPGINNSRAWPQIYAVAGAYRLLGINEFSSRLISVIAGSLLVLAGYWFSRAMGSPVNFSLVYSAVLAFSFSLIDFSRSARMYSLYALVFLILAALIYRSKWLAAGLLFLLAYWLQLLTLILPIALLVWAMISRRFRLVIFLLTGLAIVGWLDFNLGVDFFHRNFLGWVWPPHWQYLPWWLAPALILNLYRFRANPAVKYVTTIIVTYLVILIFVTNFPPGAAYILVLLPLSLWLVLNCFNSGWWWGIILLLTIGRLAAGSGYLYFGRDDRARIPQAYAVALNHYQEGDKIYAVQLRDYYLQSLPPETKIVDLQVEPRPEFSGSGLVIWEKEKAVHFQPEVLAYIKSNLDHLAGEGIDNFGVEVYSFGK